MNPARNTFIPLIKTLIFSILVPGSVTVLFPFLLLSNDLEVLLFDPGAMKYGGMFPILLGLLFYVWSAYDFAVFGKGTPAPLDPPKRLVIKGPYRYTRNPMYTGGVLILIGESLYFGSATLVMYACFVWLMFHLFVILYEEPHLKTIFGANYEAFMLATPRWIPRVNR